MLALAQRLRRELDEAKVSYRKQRLKFVSSFGVASLTVDAANSIEDLMRLALQRLQAAPRPLAEAKPGLPGEIERALRVLEKADPGRLGDAAEEVLARLTRLAKLIQGKRR